MRLITIPISHFCEKARWAADHHRIPYVEDPQLPGLHLLANRRVGGGRTLPVLAAPSATFSDSTDILHHFEGLAAPETRLYPDDAGARSDVDALEDLFDVQLGPATRLWAYFHVLPEGARLASAFSAGYRPRQKIAMRLLFPVAAVLIRRRYRITLERAEQKLAVVRSVFDQVGNRLADGRRYLAAGRFTAADLTFAALAAPVVFPRRHPVQSDDLTLLPHAMLPVVEELRATPAGRFAIRIYSDHR